MSGLEAAALSAHSLRILIDVTGTEAATTGNGHAYFRNSPWVCSDIIVSLLYGLALDERGFVRLPHRPIWSFPENDNERLNMLLKEYGTSL